MIDPLQHDNVRRVDGLHGVMVVHEHDELCFVCGDADAECRRRSDVNATGGLKGLDLRATHNETANADDADLLKCVAENIIMLKVKRRW